MQKSGAYTFKTIDENPLPYPIDITSIDVYPGGEID